MAHRNVVLKRSILNMLVVSLFLLSFIGCYNSPTQPDLEGTDGMQLDRVTTLSGPDIVIQTPEVWEDLVVFAHGYVDPDAGPTAWRTQLNVLGPYLPDLVNEMGYAFAASGFRREGLIIPDAIEDILALIEEFTATYSAPRHIYLVGASEGGLITALAVEQHPEIFAGGLALCGPVGNFRKQLDYLGDFHVVFNYYFPGLIPNSSPAGVSPAVYNAWGTTEAPGLSQLAVIDYLFNQPSPDVQNRIRKLLSVTHAPVDPGDVKTVAETILGILRYNIIGTNNAISVLGGQPFDNTRRWYSGTGSFREDWRLNRAVQRISADPAAATTIDQQYQTTGDLARPIVMLHTTRDPIVPYWHEPIYRLKVFSNGSSLLHSNFPVFRYGHCNFEVSEVQKGFALLVTKVRIAEALASL